MSVFVLYETTIDVQSNKTLILVIYFLLFLQKLIELDGEVEHSSASNDRLNVHAA